jgi:hypothetical protein
VEVLALATGVYTFHSPYNAFLGVGLDFEYVPLRRFAAASLGSAVPMLCIRMTDATVIPCTACRLWFRVHCARILRRTLYGETPSK